MPVSPICLVADGLGPFLPTTGGVNVGPNDTISIRLNDTTGVVTWFLQVLGTDELSTAPSLTNVNPVTHQVATPGSTVTFAYPNARGRALLFQSTVTGPGGPVVTTFEVYTVTTINKRVGAVGETREGSTAYGWITIVNPIIRLGAGALFYDDTISSPLLGASTIQQAIDIIKSTPTFVAGGDLSGTATNQTVIGIQTRPVSSAAPGANTFLGWSGTQWAPLVVSFINGMPVPLSTTAHQGDFLRVTRNPFVYPSGAIWDGTNLWVGSHSINSFLKIDTSTTPPTLVKKFSVPFSGMGAVVEAVDSTHAYVDGGGGGEKLLLVNKTTGAIEGVIVPAAAPQPPDYPGIFSVTVNGDDIYVASGVSSNSAQIDRYSKSATLSAYPSGGTPVATLPPLDPAGIGHLIFGGGFLFSITENPTLGVSSLRRHNPTTLAVVDSYSGTGSADYFYHIVYAFGSVWLTRASPGPTNRVQRFNPASLSGGPTATVSMPAFVQFLTNDASTIWVTNGSAGLYRISTGTGTEALIATVPAPDVQNSSPIAFDGTYIWVPEYSFVGEGPTDGIRNCSTGLGTEAYVSFWQGPITLEYDSTFSSTSDFGYRYGDPNARITAFQGMPANTSITNALPGAILTPLPIGLGTPSGVVSDPNSGVIWVADSSIFVSETGTTGAIVRINGPSDPYPQAVPITAALPTNPFTSLTPQRLAVDGTHVLFTSQGSPFIGILDKATGKLVGLGTTGNVNKFATAIIVNGNDIFVQTSNTSEIQKFSKSAILSGFPSQVSATATLALPGGFTRFNDVTFGGGFLFAAATATGALPGIIKINPAGSMSVVSSGTGASGDGLRCLYAFGSVWVTTGTATVLRFDPANLAGGPIATVTTVLASTFGITSDTTTNTIWVGDGAPFVLGQVVQISTTLGSEAVVVTIPGNGDGLQDLAISGDMLWAGTQNSELVRFSKLKQSFDLLWQGPIKLDYLFGQLTRAMFGGMTLSNTDRYTTFTPYTSGSNGATLFLPPNPAGPGQKHTISVVGTIKGQLHGNGYNIDGLPSLSFSTRGDGYLGMADSIDPSITVTWDGTEWKVNAYGGSNPMLLGDLTGKQRRNRLRHIGPIGVPNLPLASTPGSSLGIALGSQPKIIATLTGECDIFRAGCGDFLRYTPTTSPPGFQDTFAIRLPEKWSCTNAVQIAPYGYGPFVGQYLVGDRNSGRLAVLVVSASGDEPGVAQIYNTPYIGVDVLLYYAGTGLYYLSSGQGNYFASFEISGERFHEFSASRGYNSLFDGGNGFLYGTPSDGTGQIHKINPTTGAVVLTVACPDGPTPSLSIGCKFPGAQKLILLNNANRHYYSFNIPTDSFDGVNFDLSATLTSITGVAGETSENVSLAFIGPSTSSGGAIVQITSSLTTPVLGTVIRTPVPSNLSAIVFQPDAAPVASFIISDAGRDLILHIDSTSFIPVADANMAGVLTVLSPPTIGDNGDGIRSGPARALLGDNQIGSLEAIFVHTPYVDNTTIAGADLVINERRLFFAASVSHSGASAVVAGSFTPAAPGGNAFCNVSTTAGFVVGMTITINQGAPAFSGTFVIEKITLNQFRLGTVSTTGTPPFLDGASITFTAGPVDGQLFSTELAGHQTGLDYSLPADFTTLQKNPSALIGVGVPQNFFNLFAVGSGGATSIYTYETIHSTQNDSNIIWSAGTESWTGARACYVYTTQQTGTFGDFAELFFTAPTPKKLYQGNIFFDTGDPSSETFENLAPTAICAAGDNTFWVSFIDVGVTPRLRKYQVTATGTARPTYAQVGTDVFGVGNVYELCFDGKYLWALSSDGSFGTIYKLDQSGFILGSFAFTQGAVTAQSRMCSDGSSVWMTRGTVITRIYSEGPVLPLFDLNIPGGGFTQARGIVCDPYDKTIYVACYGTSLSIYAWYPPTGGWVEASRRRAVWKTNDFGMPSAFVATDIATLGAIGPKTTRTFEIDITATDGTDSGSWKKYVTCFDNGTDLTIVGSAGDVMPPMLSAGAISNAWDVTVATNTSTYSAGNTLQVTIDQGSSANPTDWTLDIKETRTFGGAL